MDNLTQLALELLQTTQELYDSVHSEELEQLAFIQQQRARLVTKLNEVSQQEWPNDVKVECRTLVEKTRQLEQVIIRTMTEKREAIGHEYDQLRRNQKARKAYGDFS